MALRTASPLLVGPAGPLRTAAAFGNRNHAIILTTWLLIIAGLTVERFWLP